MSTSKRIVANAVTYWIASGARVVIAFFIIPFLLKVLGKNGYGLIGLVGVLLSCSQVVDLGLRQALGRELAEQVARKDQRTFNELISTALVLYLGIALALALVGWVLAPWLVDIFKVSEALRFHAIWMIRVYGTGSIIFSFITPVYSAALSSYHRFDLINGLRIFGSVASGIMLFLIIPLISSPLWGWVGVMLLDQVTVLLFSLYFTRKICPGFCISFRHLAFARLRPLFQLGGYMYALQMTRVLSERSDPMVISYFFGPAGVALYQPGGRISSLTRPAITAVANQLYPLTTKCHVDKAHERMRQLLFSGTKFMLLLAVPICVGLITFAEPFCRIWLEDALGADYHTAALIVKGWALADLFMYLGGVQWAVLLGMKKLKFITAIQLPAALLNLLLSIWLVGFTKIGIPGVLLATIGVNALIRPIMATYTVRSCGSTMRAYFLEAYKGPLIVFAVISAACFALSKMLPINNYFDLGVVVSLVGVCWVLSCWFFALNQLDKAAVFKVACGAFGGIRKVEGK